MVIKKKSNIGTALSNLKQPVHYWHLKIFCCKPAISLLLLMVSFQVTSRQSVDSQTLSRAFPIPFNTVLRNFKDLQHCLSWCDWQLNLCVWSRVVYSVINKNIIINKQSTEEYGQYSKKKKSLVNSVRSLLILSLLVSL